jgi:hypothetical protein
MPTNKSLLNQAAACMGTTHWLLLLLPLVLTRGWHAYYVGEQPLPLSLIDAQLQGE